MMSMRKFQMATRTAVMPPTMAMKTDAMAPIRPSMARPIAEKTEPMLD
jgi:hypothetical protein